MSVTSEAIVARLWIDWGVESTIDGIFGGTWIATVQTGNNLSCHNDIHNNIENRELAWCQLCCHWGHRRLSSWQPTVPLVTTKLASWCLSVFNKLIWYRMRCATLCFVFIDNDPHGSRMYLFTNAIRSCFMGNRSMGSLNGSNEYYEANKIWNRHATIVIITWLRKVPWIICVEHVLVKPHIWLYFSFYRLKN